MQALCNRLKVFLHRICTSFACSTCVYMHAFNITNTVQFMYFHVLSILPRGDLSVLELDIWWNMLQESVNVAVHGLQIDLYQCLEKLAAVGKVICMYLIAMTGNYMYASIIQRQRNSFHTVIKLLVLNYLERFKKKLILILNLPNYK